MTPKTYDDLKRLLEAQTGAALAPLLGLAGKGLGEKQLDALRRTQLTDAKAAVVAAERDRERARAWHDAEVARAHERLQRLEKGFEPPAVPASQDTAPGKTPPAKNVPVKTAPVKAVPVKIAPAKTVPAKTAPAKAPASRKRRPSPR